jgi:hypothetical protein
LAPTNAGRARDACGAGRRQPDLNMNADIEWEPISTLLHIDTVRLLRLLEGKPPGFPLERRMSPTRQSNEHQENSMRHLVNALVCMGFICAGAQALAGDPAPSATPPAPADHQMFKDCMAKHAAQNDGTSRADMKQACIKEVHMQQKGRPAVANPPPAAAPEDH